MSGYFNIDKAVKHIKFIADKNRCNNCDKLPGLRLRYACGHLACKECADESDECLTCFNSVKNSAPVIDTVQSQHVQNVFKLLTSFQEAFKIDVNKRHRLSEKLKEEQQFFPEGIEASVKYYNKRRISQISNKKAKENLPPFIAGEGITCLNPNKMKTRVDLVKKWLESNENIQRPVRKPFGDINVNNPFILSKENNDLNKSKQLQKRSYVKKKKRKGVNRNKNIVILRQQKSLKNVGVPNLSQSKDQNILKDQNIETEITSDNKLNGSEPCQIDKTSPNETLDTIVIEDTQTHDIDKDKEAWLAVIQTEKNRVEDGTQINTDSYDKLITQAHTIVPVVSNTQKNVSYFKKAPLHKSCHLCENTCENDVTKYQRLQSNDMFITVNTTTVTTSIRITNNECFINCKKSISTQTVEFTEEANENVLIDLNPTIVKKSDASSQDLFVNDTNLFEENSVTPKKDNLIKNDIKKSVDLSCQVISDSDSDSDIHCSGTFEVIAEVHTPSEKDYGVLSAITNENDYQRVRNTSRRCTVDSNNSSEKENLEPNRPKKPRVGKKQNKKK